MLTAVKLYPCELLCVHRDAEAEDISFRRAEIQSAFDLARGKMTNPPRAVCVIPVRMMEAWLLFDESLIRQAAGNPNGNMDLDLPRLQNIEQLADPKRRLHEVLRTASGLAGRRLKSLNVTSAVHRIAQLSLGFERLRDLPAFRQLEEDMRSVLAETIVR